MRRTVVLLSVIALAVLVCQAKSNGAWMKKVSPSDRARTNPFAGQSEAIAAGKNLFLNHCAQCHGQNAQGRGSHPALRSQRLRSASDGEIAWIVKNGNPFSGMPSWGALPEPERWQIVAYLRSLNANDAGVRP